MIAGVIARPAWLILNRLWDSCYLVAKSCPDLCNSMDYSTPVSSVLPYLPGSVLCLAAQLCPPVCDTMDRSPPDSAQIHAIQSVMLSDHLILCCPLLLLLSIFPSIRVFPNESALFIRRPEYWSFSFSISSSHEYSGWISFRTD